MRLYGLKVKVNLPRPESGTPQDITSSYNKWQGQECEILTYSRCNGLYIFLVRGTGPLRCQMETFPHNQLLITEAEVAAWEKENEMPFGY